jgi:hypothetical protein
MAGKKDWTRAALARDGFTGWDRFGDLRSALPSIDTGAGGVYVVYRTSRDDPIWLDKSPGGTWNGDPTVSKDELVANWIDGAHVVYIGKADHGRLRTRLRQYHGFGQGGNAPHSGGRLVWQIEGSAELLVAWRVIADRSVKPLDVERAMLRRFHAAYRQLPFANLRN